MAYPPIPIIRCGTDAYKKHLDLNAGRVAQGDEPFELILDESLKPNEFTTDPLDGVQ